jgi:hypothetical protein
MSILTSPSIAFSTSPVFAEANSINLIRTDQRCNDFRSEFCQFRGFLTDRSNFTITRSHST